MEFSTNLATASITSFNGHTVTFFPKDINFASDVYDFVEDIRRKLEEQPPADKQDVFKVAKERDQWARKRLDEIFGDGMAQNFFGRVNVFTNTELGTPLITNFIMDVVDKVDAAASAKVEISPKLQEYISKYEGKYNV